LIGLGCSVRQLDIGEEWRKMRIETIRGSALVVCCALGIGSAARGSVITSSDIYSTTGNEVGSGNGTLDLIFFTDSQAKAPNAQGAFNGDDANTAMPKGVNNGTANVSYITSMGEIRAFYRLNFSDGSGGSTINNLGVFLDMNQIGSDTHLDLDAFSATINYNLFSPATDTRNNPANNDIHSNVQEPPAAASAAAPPWPCSTPPRRWH